MNNLLPSTLENAVYGVLSACDSLQGTGTPDGLSYAVTAEVTFSEVYTSKDPQVKVVIEVTVNQI